MTELMLSYCRSIVSDFQRSWASLLGCELVFKLLAFALLGPISTWIVLKLIALSGQAAISNVEIVDFLLSPLGWLTLVALIGLAWAVVFLGQSALLLVQIGRLIDRPQSVTQATVATIRRAPVIIELVLAYVAMYFFSAAPFLIVGWIIYGWLLSDFDINYYLSERPSEFWLALVLAGILTMGNAIAWCCVYTRAFFAWPECVLNSQRPIMALRRSYDMTRNHAWVILKYMIFWFLVYSVVTVLIAIVVQLIEYLSMQAAGESFSAVALVIGLLLTLDFVVATLVTVVGNVSQTLLIGRLYWSLLNGLPPLGAAKSDDQGLALPGIARQTADDDFAGPTWLSTWFAKRRMVWMSVALVSVSSLGCCLFVLSSVTYEDQVQVTAHRGSSKEAPENTLSAIEQAITDGADYAEIDVQETSDGVVVVMHDTDFMRIAGERRSIWDTPLEDLRKIDAGRWFNESFTGERVPTLQEVIELAEGKIKLNIELKFNRHEQALVSRTLRIVKETNFEPQCVVSSLKHQSLTQVRAIEPTIQVGAIVGAVLGDPSRLDADFISINVGEVNRALIRNIHRQGKEIHVWTVNDVKIMSDMIGLGVDNILTDEPQKLIQLLDERQQLSEIERMLLMFRKLIEY